MCVDCNKETITGVVYYSGLDFTVCNNITITNGEDMNIVLSKLKQCIDHINQEIDITGLTENSSCITLIGASIKDVLQSILNTESEYCTKFQDLETRVSNLEDLINGTDAPTIKTTSITTCEIGAVTKTETPTNVDFKFNVGLVPKNTVLPYIGPRTDFDTSGKGLAHLAGWYIANGQNGTSNLCGRYLKYDCDPCCGITGGRDTFTIMNSNLPDITLNASTITVNLDGKVTSPSGKHKHRIYMRDTSSGGCGSCDLTINDGEDPCTGGANGIENATGGGGCYGSRYVGTAGEHTHTLQGDVTGTITGQTIDNLNTPINLDPSYVSGIPIVYLGC